MYVKITPQTRITVTVIRGKKQRTFKYPNPEMGLTEIDREGSPDGSIRVIYDAGGGFHLVESKTASRRVCMISIHPPKGWRVYSLVVDGEAWIYQKTGR